MGISLANVAFCTAATENRGLPTLKLQWTTDDPVWVAQWPLPQAKLQPLQTLVKEQLELSHIRPSTSDWNTPIFVIKKKSGKWRLLHDLRTVNAVMKSLGALQPGLPSPAAIPRDWYLLIIDLKDYFFSIPLHPEDTCRFAFSVPQVNNCGPTERYEWTVLPQGMKNSPTICQWFVNMARQLWKATTNVAEKIVYHYMDDILIATKHLLSDSAERFLRDCLRKYGLTVAEEKIQRQAPWLYLGMQMTEHRIRLGKILLHKNVQTVNDVQKLVGDIQWIRTWCGITNAEMEPLLQLLHDSTDPAQPRTLTAKACEALKIVETKLSTAQTYRYSPDQPVNIAIYGDGFYLSAIIFQLIDKVVCILEWVFPPAHPASSIVSLVEGIGTLLLKARKRVRQVFGIEPSVVYLPWKSADIQEEWSLQNTAYAVATVGLQLCYHYPAHPIFKTALQIFERPIVVGQPIVGAQTLLTDASGKTGRYGYACLQEGIWQASIHNRSNVSVQVLELQAVVNALTDFSKEPVNLITDSLYVAGIINRIECASIGHVNNANIAALLLQLRALLWDRIAPLWCSHIRSHTNIPGIIAQGNAYIDQAVSAPIQTTSFARARSSHAFFHQSARSIQREFHITREQARAIVAACPECARIQPLQPYGANP